MSAQNTPDLDLRLHQELVLDAQSRANNAIIDALRTTLSYLVPADDDDDDDSDDD